ncbi:MAG: fluoride efflux transporter CrcB [Desulfobulbaceae bacterium]|jgi:CrcB protein|nr:fluoride efflux transporter CrcB [Desulfobulbaceae bacterium]
MLTSICAISAGAVVGALCRWGLGLALNAVFPPIPLGTLTANIGGGFFIGLAISLFSALPQAAPEWRLAVITGFLGALTTFSTFSAEVATLLQQGRLFLAMATIGLHVGGSLAALFLGMGVFAVLKNFLP